jgi:hypothetical protein
MYVGWWSIDSHSRKSAGEVLRLKEFSSSISIASFVTIVYMNPARHILYSLILALALTAFSPARALALTSSDYPALEYNPPVTELVNLVLAAENELKLMYLAASEANVATAPLSHFEKLYNAVLFGPGSWALDVKSGKVPFEFSKLYAAFLAAKQSIVDVVYVDQVIHEDVEYGNIRGWTVLSEHYVKNAGQGESPALVIMNIPLTFGGIGGAKNEAELVSAHQVALHEGHHVFLAALGMPPDYDLHHRAMCTAAANVSKSCDFKPITF